ncbi:MAG: OsmC family protein [Nitrospinae bacterium]|jgi:organic hydroperoxide reductase OsmC/OhrA|nr:OsmC family protein [Nitrospinota bacterium]MDA1109702.1 OsmC family protein [Nitrospinota bacterium]
MSEHRVRVSWVNSSEDFVYETFNRDHLWTFDNGAEIKASSAPAFMGNPDCVDPEEGFVGALSSCHMLTFLAISAKKRLTVTSYEDDAVGFLEKNENGKLAVTRIILRPKVAWGKDETPTQEEVEALHQKAHGACFIANSILTEVAVEPR